jgi:hypothetical protein
VQALNACLPTEPSIVKLFSNDTLLTLILLEEDVNVTGKFNEVDGELKAQSGAHIVKFVCVILTLLLLGSYNPFGERKIHVDVRLPI